MSAGEETGSQGGHWAQHISLIEIKVLTLATVLTDAGQPFARDVTIPDFTDKKCDQETFYLKHVSGHGFCDRSQCGAWVAGLTSTYTNVETWAGNSCLGGIGPYACKLLSWIVASWYACLDGILRSKLQKGLQQDLGMAPTKYIWPL